MPNLFRKVYSPYAKSLSVWCSGDYTKTLFVIFKLGARMTNLDEDYYQTKNNFFNAFMKFTFKSIVWLAIFLALLAIIFV